MTSTVPVAGNVPRFTAYPAVPGIGGSPRKQVRIAVPVPDDGSGGSTLNVSAPHLESAEPKTGSE
jgi:hypothetical protein